MCSRHRDDAGGSRSTELWPRGDVPRSADRQDSLDQTSRAAEQTGSLLKVTLTEDKSDFLLSIHLDVPPGGHTYSTDSGFSGATRIKLIQTEGVEPVEDKFASDHEPKIEFQDAEMVEKFKDAVTWQRASA